MRFRLKAFAIHIGASACALAVLLGILYLGWYRWPGWYVTNFLHVMSILVGVDVTMGPLFTLLIANPRKPRRDLARDVGVIVTLQVVALAYGIVTLWGGRPLYYAYSQREMETVAASQVPASEAELARQRNPDFAPHWYRLPRLVYASLPAGAPPTASGLDVTQMPRYFKSLSQGGSALRADLKKVDDQFIFTPAEKRLLKERMVQRGLAADQPDTLFMIGRDRPVLVVLDPKSLRLQAIIRAN
ncbi:MAG TPA: hypothetical protein VN676_04910 [Steroidobacteraceae bacterium]|nr:hypothetical protein [Steroidobacteraceae bacterium]